MAAEKMCILCLGGMFCKYPFVLTLLTSYVSLFCLDFTLMCEWDIRSSPSSARDRFIL